ncbi:HEPN domain-containing protein [Caldicellulosiruptor changbaiensis]|uniref:HEPN domain-containing protein n=1 Tax=Caldicellulosiruptor changbaiensis TaxID=1222016 RepID=A0A3T0D677_9FIRM|nr:HEPN domain-containing protein [Caldicellulosiruptor changbaiensis]AZT90554.1 HEPN domain-containing protein [Caldicellulosiruptor changbaiensis]
MDEYIKALSFYRLEKAKEDLKAAKVNYENGLYKASINRSYYAIFHAIRAVNAINKFDSKRHSGVIAYFNQHFIHTEKFSKELYKIVASAFKLRERCDYDDFYMVSRDQAENQLKNAEFFIKEVERFICEHLKEK